MFNFKIWFSINIPKINTVLIKILVYKCVSKSKYTSEGIKIAQGAVCTFVEMFTYWLVTHYVSKNIMRYEHQYGLLNMHQVWHTCTVF